MEQRIRRNMICVLKGELVKALGCTEPIAIAYVSAKAREILGKMPEKIVIGCSGNKECKKRCSSNDRIFKRN